MSACPQGNAEFKPAEFKPAEFKPAEFKPAERRVQARRVQARRVDIAKQHLRTEDPHRPLCFRIRTCQTQMAYDNITVVSNYF